ncbi:hypothetical protein ALGA_2358 [Labilibaculum antarcticum]|uniref:Uncharacterized protein n=1 Tax=Labilibaculum antarcticum TaxID=1717717 RepID=A0A1Y1CK10_9BACT|nr:hypothetical protein ALGA_2358 [Labilibaculum antarcticum]
MLAREIKLGVEEVHETSFTSDENIIVNGTLIVLGDLVMGEKESLTINEGGIVIVTGNLLIGKNVSVSALGYLIAESFTSPDKWGGKFKEGAISKVFINEAYGGDKQHMPVLLPGGHSIIPELEGIDKDVWDYYQKVIGGVTGGTIELDGSSTSCAGSSLPSIVNMTVAWPAAFKKYSWEYSVDNNNWNIIEGQADIELISLGLELMDGAYYFRRKVSKKNDEEDYMYSNYVEVTVVPLPAPIGIFFK